MPPQNPCCRCWLTSLHVIVCVTGGFYAIWLLLRRQVDETCLAKSSSILMSADAQSLTCDITLYTCFVAALWSLLSVIIGNFCSFRKSLATVQILLSSVLGLLFVTLGCMLTIDFVEWCASISACSNHDVCPPSDCLKASQYNDSFLNNNATLSVFWNSAVGMICVWTLGPAVITLALCYVASLWLNRPASPTPEQPVCQGHCCGHAHFCPRGNVHGPIVGNSDVSPPRYSDTAGLHLNPDSHPLDRGATADTPSHGVRGRPREEDHVPLLTNPLDSETRSEGYDSMVTAAPFPSTNSL